MNDIQIIYDAIKSRFGEFKMISDEDMQLVADYFENGFQTSSNFIKYYFDGKDLHIVTLGAHLTPESSKKILLKDSRLNQYEIYICAEFTNAKEYSYDTEGNAHDYIVSYSTKLLIYTGAFKKL